MVMFSGVTDCYQPIEAVYKLTQGCLQVCRDFKNPAALITKSFLITRDVELLAELNRIAFCTVTISIPFASDEMARKIEPQASSIERRFQALETLAKAGIPVGVSLAPTIPGLNENDIPIVLKRAKNCGARYAFHALVRLSGSVQPVFEEKIKAALPPERVDRILKRLRETRQGKMNDSRFGHRHHGEGTYWKSISDVFRLNQKKYELDNYPEQPFPSTFRRPSAQMELW